MLKIRRSRDRRIFNMGIPTGKDGLYIERGPSFWNWNVPENSVNAMAQDALIPCVAKSATAAVFTV